VIDAGLFAVASSGIQYRAREYPSQWAGHEYVIPAEAGTESPGKINIWWMPVNVGIMDACIEARRGVLCIKCVQVGVSTAMLAVVGYFLARIGGSIFYCLNKAETMRTHAITRFEPMIKKSGELSNLLLEGRKGKETTMHKLFRTGSLTLASAATENNFISVGYNVMCLDEYDKMGVFPSGNDARELSEGRQEAMISPKLFGFGSGSRPDSGICAAVEHESDKREFFIECPHCKDPVTIDPLRDIKCDTDPATGKQLPLTAKLLCQLCKVVITDTQRAEALTHAAKAAAVWYTDVPPDDRLGWRSTMPHAEALKRPYAGFQNYSQLLNPRKTVVSVARRLFGCRTEAAKRTVWNDVLGRGYAGSDKSLSDDDVRQTCGITTVPDDVAFITAGADVQDGGDRDIILYYDISAWTKQGVKVTLDIGTLYASRSTQYKAAELMFKDWSCRDRHGKQWRIKCMYIDAGYRTSVVYSVCSRISGPTSAWCMPVIYNSQGLDGAAYADVPQNPDTGTESRQVTMASRNFVVGMAIDRVRNKRTILPDPIPNTVLAHYQANISVPHTDRHGNMRGMKWVKRQAAGDKEEPDDYLQAAGYCELAALRCGLDKLAGEELAKALEIAKQKAKTKEANQDEYRRNRQRQQRKAVKRHHERKQNRRLRR
jgi:phage terminase large subunit GpA-like protein